MNVFLILLYGEKPKQRLRDLNQGVPQGSVHGPLLLSTPNPWLHLLIPATRRLFHWTADISA